MTRKAIILHLVLYEENFVRNQINQIQTADRKLQIQTTKCLIIGIISTKLAHPRADAEACFFLHISCLEDYSPCDTKQVAQKAQYPIKGGVERRDEIWPHLPGSIIRSGRLKTRLPTMIIVIGIENHSENSINSAGETNILFQLI